MERIIKSDTYAGKLVQGKTSITARDENNRIHKLEDDWVVKEEAHEPLITPEIGKEAARSKEETAGADQKAMLIQRKVAQSEKIFLTRCCTAAYAGGK